MADNYVLPHEAGTLLTADDVLGTVVPKQGNRLRLVGRPVMGPSSHGAGCCAAVTGKVATAELVQRTGQLARGSRGASPPPFCDPKSSRGALPTPLLRSKKLPRSFSKRCRGPKRLRDVTGPPLPVFKELPRSLPVL